jgi:toxin YhaV
VSSLFDQRKGWKLYLHPAFRAPFDRLTDEVERLRAADPAGYQRHPKAKLLQRIMDLVLDEIPRDPTAASFRLAKTLGADYRHWRRAKFLGRFRLFFRYSSAHKAIVYAWLNDESTLRKAGSRSDPYVVFQRRLSRGDPPDDWDVLMREVAPSKSERGSEK